MSIQAALNNQAISMLPATKAYIDRCSGDRAGHHNHVIVQKICNSRPCLDDMSSEQLEGFDQDCLQYLKWLDR